MSTSATGDRVPRWYQRVLPVTGLALAVGGLLALAVPGVRAQVTLSASHRPQEYVALSFARADDGTVPVCTTTDRAVRVRFAVASHLSERRELDYEVRVGDLRRTGTVRVAAGATAEVLRAVPRPARREFEVEVRLPGVDQQVLAHCTGRCS